MAQTETHINACNAVIAVDDDADVLTDISGSTNRVSMTFEINTGETTTFDGDFSLRMVCGKSATMDMTIVYTTAAGEAWDILKGWYHVYDGASRTVRVEPEGTGAGNDRYEGEWTMTSYSHDFDSGEGSPVMVSASFVNDGEILLLEIGT